MKNFLKKKVNVFGKSVPVFAIVILGLALVSAALVPYLSGLVSGDVSVDSPVVLMGADGSSELTETWTADNQLPDNGLFSTGAGSLDLTAELYGGDGEGFWIKAKNLADVEVVGYLVFEVTCDKGITINGDGSIGDFDAEMTVYDEQGGTKKVTGPYDVESELVPGSITISPINEADGVADAVRFYGDTSLWNAGKGYGNIDYVYIDLDFELNAVGDYTIKAAYLKENPDIAEFPTE